MSRWSVKKYLVKLTDFCCIFTIFGCIQLKLYLLAPHFAQRTLYDYRGIDGTGTASSPATGSNQVSYTVRKLADGNCWMSENLKLTLSTSHAYEVATFSGGTTSWTPNSGSTNTYNAALNGNTVCSGSGSSRQCWYNFYAATAGQGTETYSSDITKSICPKGWRMTTQSGNQSFTALKSRYSIPSSSTGVSRLKNLPFSFTAQPGYNNGSISVASGVYPYMTSTIAEYNGYRSFIDFRIIESATDASPGIWTDNSQGKSIGAPLRCVAIP